MMQAAANFDRLARIYRLLEMVAFGGDLERARFRHVNQLATRRSILILGEGDGRFLARLLPLVPDAHIHCIDSSAAMLARAEARIASVPGRHQVRFEQANVLDYTFDAGRYDAVVTLFFLDCFEAEEASQVVERINGGLQAAATWLYADFSLPDRGVARLRARLWLGLLYFFFRWQTGLTTRRLPPAEALIRRARFAVAAAHRLQAGLLHSVHFERGQRV